MSLTLNLRTATALHRHQYSLFQINIVMRELYYQLEIDNWPLTYSVLPLVARHTKIEFLDIDKNLIDMLRYKGVRILSATIFYSFPGFYTRTCHTDGISDNTIDWQSLAKLNYVTGEKNTFTLWYDVPVEKRHLRIPGQTPIGQAYECYDLSHCVTVEKCTINGWHLFEAGVPHTVMNPTKNPKWTISFSLGDLDTGTPLSFEESKKRILKSVE